MSVVDASNLSNLDIIGRLAMSLAVGGALGLEREIDGHEAGFRTHALLALGAGVFGVVSVGGFSSFISDTSGGNVQVDVTRIASYVAAGVGFLAGGAIVKGTTRVKGLTTAASLWVCAAVGLAAGLGFYVGALTGTVLALIMLVLDRPVSRLRRSRQRAGLHVRLRDASALGDVMAVVLPVEHVRRHPHVAVRRSADGGVEVDVTDLPTAVASRLIADLSSLETVDEASLHFD